MSNPIKDESTSFAVICHTCGVNVWQGNELVEQDGQVLLTAFADSVPGPACPSKVNLCPHKAAVLTEQARHKAVTAKDLELLEMRLAKLEKK